MSLAPLHPITVVPGRLREAAEQIEQSTGLRVEVLGGTLMMSPTPRGKHMGTINRIREQLTHVRSEGLVVAEMISMPMEGDLDDYATPDLSVLPVESEDSEDWLFDPRDFALAVEVISKSERTLGIADKVRWYALAGAPTLLQIDPRDGTWTLYDSPEDDSYRAVRRGKFGEDILLPHPLGELKTDALPRYESVS